MINSLTLLEIGWMGVGFLKVISEIVNILEKEHFKPSNLSMILHS